MDNASASVKATVAAIEDTFDGHWGVWLSDTGNWWASRRGALTAAQLNAGCTPYYLRAQDPDQLKRYITEQENLSVQSTTTGTGQWQRSPQTSPTWNS